MVRFDKTLAGALMLSFMLALLGACKGQSSDSGSSGGPVIPPDQGMALTLSPALIPDGEVNQAYLVTVKASGGFTPYTFTAVSGMPHGLVINAAGSLGGVPTTVGNFAPRIRVSDAKGSQAFIDYTLNIVAAGMLPVITTSSLPSATIGGAYAFPLAVSGGSAPYSFSDDGNLPPNMMMDADGLISGNPMSTGAFALTISVVDALGSMAVKLLTLEVTASQAGPQVITTSPPAAQLGVPYAFSLQAVSGTAPYTWRAIDVLPSGLSLAGNGQLSGIATQSGVFNVQVTATDNNQVLGSAIITITVN